MNTVSAALLVLSAALSLAAATDRSGVLERNEHWTRAGSPYIISDDLLVPPDVMLRIDPGVQIMAGRPVAYSKAIPQFDRNDSFMVSIRVQGSLKIQGRAGQPVIFGSQRNDSTACTWFGLILDAPGDQAEVTFAEISDACNGIVVKRGRPLIAGTVLAYNNVGLMVCDKTQPVLENCIVTRNTTAGVFVQNANPAVRNSILAFNAGTGIMSDGRSSLDVRYNCVFGNGDRGFESCDPLLGMVKKKVRERYPADAFDNILADPVFAGSIADSAAVEKDLSLSTDRSRVKNLDLLNILHKGKTNDSLANRKRTAQYSRWVLSRYSPCLNAGNPAAEFSDGDGSRNDMGIYGGPAVGGAEKASPKEPTEPEAATEPSAPEAVKKPHAPAAATAPSHAEKPRAVESHAAPAHAAPAHAAPAHGEAAKVPSPEETKH